MTSWIGVDLDGTLAEHHDDEARSIKIGPPIEPMVRRVRQWLRDGKDVRIFTARAHPQPEFDIKEVLAEVEIWCLNHLDQILPITCLKDKDMEVLYDDRTKQVERNTGMLVEELCRDYAAKVQYLIEMHCETHNCQEGFMFPDGDIWIPRGT